MNRVAIIRWGAVLAVWIAGCHAGASPSPPAPPLGAASASGTDNEEVRAVASLVNQRRSSIGCRALIWDERLARVARRHSEAMAKQGFFSHVDRNGNDPFDRMHAAGISFRAAAENIAEGQVSGREVYDGWVRSPGHRANLQNCGYTHHGIGLYRNRWTHVFARF